MPEPSHGELNAARVAPPLRRTRRLILSALVACAASVGCRGQASVYFTPMDFKRITTNRPLMSHFKPNECYYWINDDGNLCVAMQRRSGRLPGHWFRREFALSMVLGEPPTGDARTYFGHRRTLRALNHRGLAHDRYASFRGATGVWGYGTGTLHGRFRFSVKGQSYLVLTDWASDRLELLTGAFTAVENREAGERIFAKTEVQGLARPALPRKRSEKGQERRRPATR